MPRWRRNESPTDLTDDEWRVLEPLISPAKPGGRPRRVDLREIVNGVRYLLRAGGAWRLLPTDLPSWETVYASFRHWEADGTWEAIATTLRQRVRTGRGRDPEPSAAILDSQTVKTTEKGDRAGTTRGRRPAAANATISSTPTGCCCNSSSMRRTSRIATGRSWCWPEPGAASRGCGASGRTASTGGALVGWAKREAGVDLTIVAPAQGTKGFAVLPRRWVVERSIAWMGRYRRLSKDYQAMTQTSEGMIDAAFGGTMLRKLVRQYAS
jgi:putative transposase